MFYIEANYLLHIAGITLAEKFLILFHRNSLAMARTDTPLLPFIIRDISCHDSLFHKKKDHIFSMTRTTLQSCEG